jgi:phosphoserine phosphatase
VKNNDLKVIEVCGENIVINIKPEMDINAIKRDLPHGLPPGPPPYDIV